MFKWFKNLKESYNITKMNKINYNNFVHDMQQYEDNEQSMFNQLGLIFSKDKTTDVDESNSVAYLLTPCDSHRH